MGDEEYELSDSEDEAPHTTSGSLNNEDEVSGALTMSKTSKSELESEHSEWFKVEPDDLKIPEKVDDSETEEDNDSDNYDLNEPGTVEDSDGDEWLLMSKENQTESPANVESSPKVGTQSSDDFDVIEAPQIQGSAVGFWPSLSLTTL